MTARNPVQTRYRSTLRSVAEDDLIILSIKMVLRMIEGGQFLRKPFGSEDKWQHFMTKFNLSKKEN